MTTVPKRTLLRVIGATAEGDSFRLRVALLVPLVVALVYRVVLGSHIRDLLYVAYSNSDTAALPFLAELLREHPTSAPLTDISQPGYLQVDLWTSWLPMHRLVWKWAFGPGLVVVAVVAAGWAVARLSNRWAGLLGNDGARRLVRYRHQVHTRLAPSGKRESPHNALGAALSALALRLHVWSHGCANRRVSVGD
jgi:hypothetical protein